MNDRITPMKSSGTLYALHRLLGQARSGGQAKVDALMALAQHTVMLVSWPGRREGFRTVVTAEGQAALPVFTSLALLETAAYRYEWCAQDGSVPSIEVGAREAMRHAVAQQIDLIVIDLGAPHNLVCSTEEIRPLLESRLKKDSTGPFAVHGRASSTLMHAVSPGKHSITPSAFRSPTPPTGTSVTTTEVPKSPRIPKEAAALKNSHDSFFSAFNGTPAPELLTALRSVLRNFPEVQWACLGTSHQEVGAITSVGLRLDPNVRKNVDTIASALLSAGAEHGIALDTVLLDDLHAIQQARDTSLVFYPW